MKKHYSSLILMIFLLGIFSTGCGKDDGASQGEKTEYQDIVVKREYFPDFEEAFQADGERHTLKYLGTQFLGEEPIQIWAERYASGNLSNIYLWKMDGTWELVLEGVNDKYTIGGYAWYIDREG